MPFENTNRFQRKNWWRRNHCVLRAYEALGHGFYNFNVDVQKYELTLTEMDTFLTKRGIIASNPDDDGVPRLS